MKLKQALLVALCAARHAEAGGQGLPPLSGKRNSIINLAPKEFNMGNTGACDHYNKMNQQKTEKEEARWNCLQ